MARHTVQCPKCRTEIEIHRNPIPTVDIIIEIENAGIVLIKRKNPPHGWAIPGGFVDYGESLEEAAAREAKEETNLEVEDLRQFRAYSDPNRDPRFHTISMVFIAKAKGKPEARDDALHRVHSSRLDRLRPPKDPDGLLSVACPFEKEPRIDRPDRSVE